jgi:ACS family hexuronate transporter-like MFS transporter
VAFILTGLAGLVWLLPWSMIYRSPEKSKLITADELTMLQTASKTEDGENPEIVNSWSWKQVLSFRGTWLLLLARLITDPVWYFYQFWFPKYLSSDRNLSQEQLKITWVIYAAAGVGSLLGGIISGKIVKRGVLPVASRMWVMLFCALLMPLSPFIATATGLNASLTLTFFTVIAALAWLINISSLVVDIVPKHSLGTVFSVIAAGSTLGGIVMNMIVASMVTGPSDKPAGFLDMAFHAVLSPILNAVQGQGYGMWFLIMAFMHPIAWLLLKFGGIDKVSTNSK